VDITRPNIEGVPCPGIVDANGLTPLLAQSARRLTFAASRQAAQLVRVLNGDIILAANFRRIDDAVNDLRKYWLIG